MSFGPFANPTQAINAANSALSNTLNIAQTGLTAATGGASSLNPASIISNLMNSGISSANFQALHQGLQSLDATIPGSVNILQQGMTLMNNIANSSLAQNALSSLGNQKLAKNIGNLTSNLNNASVQYDHYLAAEQADIAADKTSLPFDDGIAKAQKMLAKWQMGKNIDKAQGNIGNILTELKNLV